jgi:hypothetical protein
MLQILSSVISYLLSVDTGVADMRIFGVGAKIEWRKGGVPFTPVAQQDRAAVS